MPTYEPKPATTPPTIRDLARGYTDHVNQVLADSLDDAALADGLRRFAAVTAPDPAPLVVPPWLLERAAAVMGMSVEAAAEAFNAVASQVVPLPEFSLILLGREYAAYRKPAGPGLTLRRL